MGIYTGNQTSTYRDNNPEGVTMLRRTNGSVIQTRDLFNVYLAKVESYGGNSANGDGWEDTEHMIIETGEFPNLYGELPNETKRIGSPVLVIDSYSDRRSAYRALVKIET